MRRAMVLFAAGVLGTAAFAGCSSSTKTATTSGGGATVASVATGTPVAVTAGEKSGTYYLTAEPVSVKAGPVTFTLADKGTKKHEMVVLKTDDPFDGLAVDADHKVSEDTSAGEVGEIDGGKSGTVTLDLKPGKYVLVCNIALHYGQGMRVAFTVTG